MPPKHTALPVRSSPNSLGSFIFDANGFKIARFGNADIASEVTHRVNAFEGLVEALERAHKDIRDGSDSKETLRVISSALKQAKTRNQEGEIEWQQ